MNLPPDIQVVLVSDQATPNITPLLDSEFRPRELVMVVSPDKRQQAKWLCDALKDTGIRTDTWPIDDAWNIEQISDRMLDLLVSLESKTIALNVTGGTKPMAIAAYEVFRSQDKPIFYVHPEIDHLIWMYHPDQLPARDLADRIKLPRFLLAHGAGVIGQGSVLGVPESLRALTDELILGMENYLSPLGTLNWLAQTAEASLKSEPVKTHQWHDPAFKALVELFERAGFLYREGACLVFPDEDSRFYANGGWLEAHVWGICLNLKKETGIQDIARSLKVERQTRGGGAVANELDIAFLANNRLYVIECKTAKLDPKAGSAGKGAEVLYKLDTLTDLLGGLKAGAMLVSYRCLRDSDLQRAADLRIKVCDGTKLKHLPTHLRQWIAGN